MFLGAISLSYQESVWVALLIPLRSCRALSKLSVITDYSLIFTCRAADTNP
jgi:hypothetical protein